MDAVTRWEAVGSTTWGSYISAIERAAILEAQRLWGPPANALDIGCEGGRWTALLDELGWSVTCLDVDNAALESCQLRVPSARCVFASPDSTSLACESGSVQLLLCIEVQPVVQSRWFFGEAARVLVPGGLMVAVTWNSVSIRGAAAAALSRLRRQGSHPFYRQAYRPWRHALVRQGFDILTERGLCWFPFGRASDSRLVPIVVPVEQRLGLARLPALSPWIIVTAKRVASSR
jgi:SAM-dependent methyltransferase